MLAVSRSRLRGGNGNGNGDRDGLASWEQEPYSILPISASPANHSRHGFEFDDTANSNDSANSTANIEGGVAIPQSVRTNGQGVGGAC